MRHGWTLHEMIISLVVAGAIVALAAGAAAGQLRFFRGIGEISGLRVQLTQGAMIAANVLRDVGSRADIHVASDSAIEVSATFGSALTCAIDTGRIRVTRPEASGRTLASFIGEPQAGDVVHAFVPDSTAGWVRLTVAAAPVATTCARFPDSGGWLVAITEPFVVPAGAPVRFTRRTRLSLYRASDGRWYLGLREWNAGLARFNAIQPVAGPFAGYSPTSGSGFRLDYRDEYGALLARPVDAPRVALITVAFRGATVRPAQMPGMASVAAPFHADSTSLSVPIRP